MIRVGHNETGAELASMLTKIRVENPSAVAATALKRIPHPGLMNSRQNFIIAADHPARGALSVGANPLAMGNRWDLLERLIEALSHPSVDGVLGSPDIIDDLLLAGALDGKLIFGSMNRGGLAGYVQEFDDRFTGHTAASLKALGATGGKMLARINLGDAGTGPTLEAAAHAVTELAAEGLIAMVEPFMSQWEGGQARNRLSPDDVIRSIAIASGLGATSAYTWLKIPVVDEMERVVQASTLPLVLLGGDPTGRLEDAFTAWEAALRLPNVRGLTVGRALLYPPDNDVSAAVSIAAGLLRHVEHESDLQKGV